MTSQTVTLDQFVALNDEIAALVRTGVPLELGLSRVGGDAGGKLGKVSAALAARMQKGESLPVALEANAGLLPPVYRAVVEAGLRAGRLPAALEGLSDFARELAELRRQIATALIYPFIVCALAYALFLVFTVEMVERFRETYEVFRLPLHGPLRWLIWLAERVTSWWWIPPAAMVLALVWFRMTARADVLSFGGVTWPLRWLPGVGRIGRYFQYANFAELLALLVEHDVPLPEGLRLAADATSDPPLCRAARDFADAVERGQDVSRRARGTPDLPLWWEFLGWWILLPLSAVGLVKLYPAEFPPFLHWVLWQGSRGARPARLLRHAAVIYRRRAQGLLSWFKVLFPILAAVVVGGGVTALYCLSLFGPLATFWRDLVIE